MGDMADMMVEGILCEICGEFLDGEAPGHPRRCASCKTDDWPEELTVREEEEVQDG